MIAVQSEVCLFDFLGLQILFEQFALELFWMTSDQKYTV